MGNVSPSRCSELWPAVGSGAQDTTKRGAKNPRISCRLWLQIAPLRARNEPLLERPVRTIAAVKIENAIDYYPVSTPR